MNNLLEWDEAPAKVKQIITGGWGPHFEILSSKDDDQIIAFFVLDDTTEEWQLYQMAVQNGVEDFAEYMEDAKESMIDAIGFDAGRYFSANDATADEMNRRMQERITDHKRRTGQDLSLLFYNYLMYSEWLILPEAEMEKRYEWAVDAEQREYERKGL